MLCTPSFRFLYRCDIPHPAAAAHQKHANRGLEDRCHLDRCEDPDEGSCGEAAENDRENDIDAPHETAVKHESDGHFSAGAEREVRCVGQRLEGHCDGCDLHESGRQMADLRLGVVCHGDKLSADAVNRSDTDRDHKRERDHFVAGVLGLFELARAEHLPKQNAHRVAHGHISDCEYIPEGLRDVACRHRVQSARGVALVDNGDAGRPERFVDHQRQTLDEQLQCQLAGDIQALVDALHEREGLSITVCPDDQHSQFYEAGEHRGDRRAAHAHRGRTELSEYENVVERQIDQDGDNAGRHGRRGVATLAQRARVALHGGERHETDQHDGEVVLGVVQRRRRVGQTALALHVELQEVFALEAQQRDAQRGDQTAEEQLEAERVAHALVVAAAEELRGEDACAGYRAEDAQVKDEDQLVGQRNAGHLRRANCADHNVVQHVDKVGDAVLHHDGQHQAE